MEILSPILFIEINNSEYVFVVGDSDENNNFKIIYKNVIPAEGIKNQKITDFDLIFDVLKKNIYLVEQKLNYTFKELILIIDNFNFSFLNLSGFKKLNGSEILKENITYILNSLKSTIDDIEDQKKILHIFNSKFLLDKQETQNLPIGLHGNFYSHELSFNLMDNNDYKDLSNIFKKCNLKIKKILMKNFVKGAFTSNQNSNLNTFFQIEIHKKNSRIFYFENDALKFEQRFNFGSDIVLDDISKITNLNRDIIIKILQASLFTQNKLVQDLVEKKFFEGKNYRKIKKNLLFEIATARIQELSKIILLNNINLKSYIKRETKVFLIITDLYNFECLKENFIASLSDNEFFKVLYEERISTKDLIYSASDLVNFGWKKEAVPIIHPKKSIIAKFFDAIFS